MSAATTTAGTLRLDLSCQQFLSAARDSVRIQIKQIGQVAITAVTDLDRFKSCIQTPLLLVKHAVEQDNRRIDLIAGQVRRIIGG